MFPGPATPLSAVRAFGRGAATAAENIANQLTPSYHPQETIYEGDPTGGVTARVMASASPQEVDVAKEMVDLTLAQRAIEANIQAFRSSEKTRGLIIDVLG